MVSVGIAGAQDDVPVIGVDNVVALESVVQIDYETAPEALGDLISGWLRMSHDGRRVVTINRVNDLLLWDTFTGNLTDMYSVTDENGMQMAMLDIAWRTDSSAMHSLHTSGAGYFVAETNVETDVQRQIATPTGDDLPVRVWTDTDPDFTWIEVMPATPNDLPYVMRLSLVTGEVDVQLVSAPEADPKADVRIGRMPAPLVVTSTAAGLAKLWDLETGEEISNSQVDGMPMFGHINGASGRRLAWRDPLSENLHLLDFDTGDNVQVAPLDGAYVQALLLTPPSDVILGVNIDLEPVIVAWDVTTGQRTRIGEYRACGRTPDMVQLSTDGTTLVIGCDTGLDIWRVVDDETE
ncbi:MAG: hypothetical protein AAGK74_07590 [Chloroflexota bacterium]